MMNRLPSQIKNPLQRYNQSINLVIVVANNKGKEERSMTTMDQIHRIRELYYEQGKNLKEIATIMNCDWRTVRKYVDMEDFNCPAPQMESREDHESKLDPFKPLIDSWLEADKLAPRKQRHTAKRIYKRLKDESDGFDCSYRLVACYVKEKKETLKLNKTTGYIPLHILDEWVLLKPTDTEQKDIFELLDRIRKKSSTIFCSQYVFEEWYDQLGGEASPLADAIIDRIAHDSYQINITSIDAEHDKSMREVYGLNKTLRE